MKHLISKAIFGISILIIENFDVQGQNQLIPMLSTEQNCFQIFEETNDGSSAINVYLMSYISTMTYPERLMEITGSRYKVTNNQAFKIDFKKKFTPMFWDGNDLTKKPFIDFKYLDRRNETQSSLMRAGIDPEVALISTPKYLIISWRGTDRVWNPDNDYYEWIGTDFRAPLISMPGMFEGKVHGYFWHSIANIKEHVDSFIDNYGQNEQNGQNKQIWIIGHSLGAGLAQIYTAYLRIAKGIPKDLLHCYMFSGPSFVGDAEFVSSVHQKIGKNKLQRFEYAMDFVTLLPPGIATHANRLEDLLAGQGDLTGTYMKSGQRNYFKDLTVSGYSFNTEERSIEDGDILNLNSGCEHNPNWICIAAYEQLTSDQKVKVPSKPTFISLDGCNANGTAKSVIPPSDFPEGTYYIRSAAGSKKYLDVSWNCRLENGCAAQLYPIGNTTSNNRFKVKKVFGPLGGYTISCELDDNILGVPYKKARYLDADFNNTNRNGCRVQFWDNVLIGLKTNQEWYIVPIANTGKFIIKCVKDKKVLDAVNKDVSGTGVCILQLWRENAIDLTQQWTFEKIN